MLHTKFHPQDFIRSKFIIILFSVAGALKLIRYLWLKMISFETLLDSYIQNAVELRLSVLTTSVS